jgi:hypothetical protein
MAVSGRTAAFVGIALITGFAVAAAAFMLSGGSGCSPPSLACGTPITAYVVLVAAGAVALSGLFYAARAGQRRTRELIAAWAFAIGMVIASAVIQYRLYPGAASGDSVPPGQVDQK